MSGTLNFKKEIKTISPGSMIHIPGGKFLMGSDKFYPEEKPVHQVTVDGFRMGKYNVTNADFHLFVSETNYITVAERPLSPVDFPGVPAESLVAGSMVFSPIHPPVVFFAK